MTAILSIQNNTIYFEKFIREQLKTQELEMREQLRSQEVEMREVKAQKTLNDKIVEELRPLCEELPPDALDPVTMEPLHQPLVTACCHTFNQSTLEKIMEISGGSEGIRKSNGLTCPTCRWKFSPKNGTFPCASIMGMVNVFKKIADVFKKEKASDIPIPA